MKCQWRFSSVYTKCFIYNYWRHSFKSVTTFHCIHGCRLGRINRLFGQDTWNKEHQQNFLDFSQRRSETWQALRRFTLDDGSLRNETTCRVSSFHSFRSAGCVSWRVSQRSFPSITCVCELMGQLVDSSPGSRSVTIGDCLNGSVSDGQSTLSLCWQWGEQQVGNQQGACVQTNMNISTVQDQTSKKAVFLNQGS